ncbi:MAG: hypothetical protein A2Y55_06160 [Actinobacteria bacterium RBG_16_68_12]|nr:MAG: hypothetical protein A2Y55_06160 [Actinobacteria bacterium RBG_16_68_12]
MLLKNGHDARASGFGCGCRGPWIRRTENGTGRRSWFAGWRRGWRVGWRVGWFAGWLGGWSDPSVRSSTTWQIHLGESGLAPEMGGLFTLGTGGQDLLTARVVDEEVVDEEPAIAPLEEPRLDEHLDQGLDAIAPEARQLPLGHLAIRERVTARPWW